MNETVTKPEAALTALSTSALSPSWTSVMISSVAGLIVENVLPDTDGWNSLLMKICNYVQKNRTFVLIPGLFLAIKEKTQGGKTQNSRKKLKTQEKTQILGILEWKN